MEKETKTVITNQNKSNNKGGGATISISGKSKKLIDQYCLNFNNEHKKNVRKSLSRVAAIEFAITLLNKEHYADLSNQLLKTDDDKLHHIRWTKYGKLSDHEYKQMIIEKLSN